MKTLKFSLLFVCTFLFVGLVLGTAVKADNTVTATVDIAVYEVTVDIATFDYGTMEFGETETSFAVIKDGDTSQNIGATVGNVATALDISGANTGDWTLATTVGADTYVHRFGTATDQTTVAGSYTPLNTEGTQQLSPTVDAEGTQWFGLEIAVPTGGTAAQQSVAVTVTAGQPD